MRSFLFPFIALITASSIAIAAPITIKKTALICPNNSSYFENPETDPQGYLQNGCFLAGKEMSVDATKSKLMGHEVYLFNAESIGNSSGRSFAIVTRDAK